MDNLQHYQGRKVSSMFGMGFRYEGVKVPVINIEFLRRVNLHFIRIGGVGRSHIVKDLHGPPGVDCVDCMAIAVRMHWEQATQMHIYI